MGWPWFGSAFGGRRESCLGRECTEDKGQRWEGIWGRGSLGVTQIGCPKGYDRKGGDRSGIWGETRT